MKESLKMLLSFFIVLFFALTCGTLIYIQYATAESLVAGHSVTFTKGFVLYGFLQNASIVFLLMIPFMLIYKIRHLSSPVATAITFSLLCIFVWIVLLPLSQIGNEKFFHDKELSLKENAVLSGGYFRKSGDNYFYFLSDEDKTSETARTLQIFDSENPEKFGNEVLLSTGKISEFALNAKPFKDSIIKQNMYDRPDRMMSLFNIYSKSVNRAWKNGFISWICFCSLGFALASTYAFVKLSKWRMINFSFIMVVHLLTFLMNTIYYSDSFFNVRLFLSRLFYGQDFSRFSYFQNHLIQMPLVAINVLFGILVIATGTIATRIRAKK